MLNDKIPPQKIQNRVVLIGSIAESINDLFQTPYSSRLFGFPQQMSGVVINANIVSQIIMGAKIGQSKTLQVWSEPTEWLWILLWTGIGSLISWRWKSLKISIILYPCIIIGTVAIAYLAFLQGWWIPLIPSILGSTTSFIILPFFTNRQLEKIQLRQTVELLTVSAKENPTARKIAIEYLKQAESQENQVLIEKIIRDTRL